MYSAAAVNTAIAGFFALYGLWFLLFTVPVAIGMFVAWCCLLKKAGIPWGFNFIPFFSTFCHYKTADSTDLFITRWGVIGGTVTVGLIHLNLLNVDPSFFVVFFYIPSAIVLLLVQAIFCHRLAENYGRTSAFGSGLFWLHPIYIMILGFSKRSKHYTASGSRSPRRYEYLSDARSSKPSKPKAPDWHCLACGAANPDSLRFCGHCGVTRGTRPERLPGAATPPAAAPGSTRPRLPATWRCPACGAENPDVQRFCGHCGLPRGAKPEGPSDTPTAPESVRAKPAKPPRRPAAWRCPACGADVPARLRFCSACGRVKDETPGPRPAGETKPAVPAAPAPAPAPAPVPEAPAKAPAVNLKKEPAAAPAPVRPVLENVIPAPAPATETPRLETEKEERHWKCTVCGAYMPEDAEVCSICGVNRGPDAPVLSVPDSWWFCAACGTRNADRHQTCTNCGAPR